MLAWRTAILVMADELSWEFGTTTALPRRSRTVVSRQLTSVTWPVMPLTVM